MSSKFDRILTGALGVVYNSSGEVVVVKQRSGPYAGSWLFPGGAIEMGEHPKDTVVREVYEETSLATPRIEKKLGVYQLNGIYSGKPYHLIMFVYVLQSDEPIQRDFPFDNVEEARWVKPDQFPIHSTDKKFLTDSELCTFDAKKVAEELARDGVDMSLIA